MACGCRFHITNSMTGSTYTTPYRAQAIPVLSPFVPIPADNAQAAVNPLTATIDLPDSLAPSAQVGVAAMNGVTAMTGSPAMNGLSTTNGFSARELLRSRRQEFLPSRVFQVKQTVVLSGVVSGLPLPAGVAVSYYVNGMQGTAITDHTGRYTLEAYPWETVAILAPSMTGYRATPESYTFSPVSYSNLDLHFHYQR